MCSVIHLMLEYIAIVLNKKYGGRYSHAADFFFTPRVHVNMVHVRTPSSTCARGT